MGVFGKLLIVDLHKLTQCVILSNMGRRVGRKLEYLNFNIVLLDARQLQREIDAQPSVLASGKVDPLKKPKLFYLLEKKDAGKSVIFGFKSASHQ